MTIDKGSNGGAGEEGPGADRPGGTATAGAGADGGRAAIEFRLDPASGVPTYRQLVQQVEQALRLGYLSRGDQLPRVKDVVGSLAINPNTVLKAYRELETRGIAAGRPGQGTFVQAEPGTVPLAELATLRTSMTAWLRTASTAGLDEGGMSALFTAAMRDFLEQQSRGGHRPGAAGPAGQGQAGPSPAGRRQDAEGAA
ncbi:MAG TPA: GntR family transcriptional regulator [Streptosporangiaceae bacterium]|jgi:GntR family transcriptional regulator